MKKLKLFGAILFLGAASLFSSPYWTSETVTVEVTDKIVKDGRYLIFTRDETFKNVDQLAIMKRNSSDVYGAVAVGDRCVFEVNGWRLRLTSSYRNIARVVSCEQL